MSIRTQEWGRGDPVIALHPLGLDSSAFAGLGADLAAWNLRTIGMDLPGFGQSPEPGGPLTPARLAEPLIEMARRMPERPALFGISMGGRVALEAALADATAFRSLVLVSPYLPWRRFRRALRLARWMSPRLAEKIPVQAIWPPLKWIADALERAPFLRDDAVAKASVRAIYYASCPATRASIVSAVREMALDPAFGPQGLWTRLPALRVPASFIWGKRDRLVPVEFARPVSDSLPEAPQFVLPCLPHAVTGSHHRCLAGAVATTLVSLDAAARSSDRASKRVPGVGRPGAGRLRTLPCRIGNPASHRGRLLGVREADCD